MQDQIVEIVSTAWTWLSGATEDWRLLITATAPLVTPRVLALACFVFVVGGVLIYSVRAAFRAAAHNPFGGVAVADFIRDVKFFSPAVTDPLPKAWRFWRRGVIRNQEIVHARATRFETRVMNVHPSREQASINLMQRFKWSLKSSQHVKTKDSRLERRGDEIWSVTETEEYVHLVFERDANLPNISRIKALEAEFFLISIPTLPSYLGPVVTTILGFFLLGAGIGLIVLPIGIFWWFSTSKKRPQVAAEIERLLNRQGEILDEVDRL